jgi:hypothetical protein
VAYKIQLPTKARNHYVFQVSFLKKYIGVAPESLPPLPDIKHGKALPQPEQIARARLNHGSWELLVHWMGREPSETSWESLEDFQDAYRLGSVLARCGNTTERAITRAQCRGDNG